MRISAAAGLLAVMLAASPAVSATSNQFDLVCKGKQQLKTGVPASAWSERFRFDLDAKRWCRGACKTVAQTGSVTADAIQAYDSRATIGGPSEAELNISRTNGKVTEHVAMGWSGAANLAEGTCQRAFFSGFPQQKF